jgi:hypothetical protein
MAASDQEFKRQLHSVILRLAISHYRIDASAQGGVGMRPMFGYCNARHSGLAGVVGKRTHVLSTRRARKAQSL